MYKRDFRDFLVDMWREIGHIEEFSRSFDRETLIKDEKTLYATIRYLEIIGEAAKNIPEEVKTKYGNIPWKEMAGMRDKLIHGYFGIDHELLWETIRRAIPELRQNFLIILEDYNLRGPLD